MLESFTCVKLNHICMLTYSWDELIFSRLKRDHSSAAVLLNCPLPGDSESKIAAGVVSCIHVVDCNANHAVSLARR